jgi:hypothetical protein
VIGLVLGLFLLQTAPQATGAVTGVVRNSTGSPAARVRVWAVTFRDGIKAASNPPASESLTETDVNGGYRIALPPGRYYIGSGSVVSPTYFPGTTNLAEARIVTVGANATIPNIDFGSFVPANRAPGASRAPGGFSLLPPGSGVLSGVLRFPDGTPAPGVSVVAIPVALVGTTGAPAPPVSLPLMAARNSPAVSDRSGAYQIPNLGAERYYVVAGHADAPIFYPGVADVTAARIVALATGTSSMDKLDFTVVRPLPGVTVSGDVFTTSGLAVTGASVRIRARDTMAVASTFGLPLRTDPRSINVGADGVFAFNDLPPGAYTVEVGLAGIPNHLENVIAGPQSANKIRVILPATMFSGRILMDDGSPAPNPQIFQDAIVTTGTNSNMPASTVLPISNDGTFNRIMEAGEFRFYLRTLPEEYEIRSMKFGSADLARETFMISGSEDVNVEVRVARRVTPPALSEVRVSGTAIDSITGMPVAAERVLLCCRDSWPTERFSAPLKPDGSFEFAGIPAGRYDATLQTRPGTAAIYTINTSIDIGSQGLNGMTLLTTPRFGQLVASIVADDTVPLPADFRPTVIFVGPNGRVRVTAEQTMPGLYVASVPGGGKYDVVVENLPQGYAVKSVVGSSEPLGGTATNVTTVITIQRTP